MIGIFDLPSYRRIKRLKMADTVIIPPESKSNPPPIRKVREVRPACRENFRDSKVVNTSRL